MNRREFLVVAAMPQYAAGPLETFSSEEARSVEALCDQIIPADDVAGAKEAGVLFYIDRQLAGPLHRFASAYHENLPRLAASCKQSKGRDFTDLPFSQQTEFLKQLEAPNLKEFFALVVDHTMQGFYGSPKHGGNRGEVSWDSLGIRDVMEGHKH